MEEGTPPGATNALKQTFNEFDKDRSGKIDKGELKSALESLGKRVNDASLTDLIQQVDVNQDGQIDFTEFVQLAYLLQQANVDVHDIHFMKAAAQMSRQRSVATYRHYQTESSSDKAKDNVGRLIEIAGAVFSVYVAIEALEAGSADSDTCLANATALDPLEVAEIADDWQDLQSAVYHYGLMALISSICQVVTVCFMLAAYAMMRQGMNPDDPPTSFLCCGMCSGLGLCGWCATGIISLVFGIMFWAQYGNVKDTCEGEGSEDFDKISRVFTLAIINFCYGTVYTVGNRPKDEDGGGLRGMMRP